MKNQELRRGEFNSYFPIEQLKPAKVNRDLVTKHAENFKSKLSSNDWLVPVVISSGYDVIEGHHRIEAAKLLGQKTVPVYIVDWINTNKEENHLDCIISLNNGNKAWNKLDYLKAFSTNNKDYKKVYDAFKSNSNNISVGNVVNAYFGYEKHIDFKNGKSKIKNEKFAKYLVNNFSRLTTKYGRKKIAAYCVREMISVAYVKAKMNVEEMDYLFKCYEQMAKKNHMAIGSITDFRPLMEIYLSDYRKKKELSI
jgi:hypothetical protein